MSRTRKRVGLAVDVRYAQEPPTEHGEVVGKLGPWVYVLPRDRTSYNRAVKDKKGVARVMLPITPEPE